MPPPAAAVFTADAIRGALPSHEALLEQLADSFVSLSAGRVRLGEVSHLVLKERNADACQKSAYLVGGDVWVVKIAGGWYSNPQRGLSPSVGLMLVFSQHTGLPLAVLLDGGHLTDLRTALAACVNAKALAPRNARAIGLVGCGVISQLLVETLHAALPDCRRLRVWARRPEASSSLVATARRSGKWDDAESVDSVGELVQECDVIFTCTPSRAPLLLASHVAARPPSLPGLHICALGSDQQGKQELDPALLAKADLIAVDNPKQCFGFGECVHAKQAGLLSESDEKVVELGHLLSSQAARQRGGAADRRLTICDSTGVGASDLCIAEAAYRALVPGGESGGEQGEASGSGGVPRLAQWAAPRSRV